MVAFNNAPAIAKSFDDISGFILNAVKKGKKSPYHVSTEKILDGSFLQKFRSKTGDYIVKSYSTETGTISTALFKGKKARYLENFPSEISTLQPDKLTQSVREVSKRGRRYSLYTTELSKEPNLFQLTNGVNMPQNTKFNYMSDYLGSGSMTYSSRYNKSWHSPYSVGVSPV